MPQPRFGYKGVGSAERIPLAVVLLWRASTRPSPGVTEREVIGVESVIGILAAAWAVLAAMAPYLLFGFLVAGLLSVFVSAQWIERHLGGRGFAQVLKASLLGVPLPLCSCGVIPVGASLRRHGASRGATTAFLLSTPQTGVDSIAVTYALLGPFLAVFRPVMALVTGLVGGTLVDALDPERTAPGSGRGPAIGGSAAAAAGCNRDPGPDAGGGCGDSCGCEEGDTRLRGRFARALRYGFVTLPRDIGKALLVGIALSGVLTVLIPPNALGTLLGGGLLPILAAMVVGVPLYVCATASVPIAVGLIQIGLTPGAAIAFLISGPATNGAALATVWRVLGRRTATVYLATVAFGAVGAGLLVDWVIAAADIPGRTLFAGAAGGAGHEHHAAAAGVGWFGSLSAAVLLGVLAVALWPRRRRAAAEVPAQPGQPPVLELQVAGMRCQGCVQSLTRALTELGGVTRVEVDLDRGLARVSGRPAADEVRAAVDGLGFSLKNPDILGV